VNVNEIQTWCRSPVAEEPWLDVLLCQGLLEAGRLIGAPIQTASGEMRSSMTKDTEEAMMANALTKSGH
jgi:hypothetical protein